MRSNYASLRRCYSPSRRRRILATTGTSIVATMCLGAGVLIVVRGSLTGTALGAALSLLFTVFAACVFGLSFGALMVYWPRTFRRINRRMRRSNRRRFGIDWSRYPILYRWHRLRQTSASAWTLRAIATGVPLGLLFTKPVMLALLKGLTFIPALEPIARSLITALRSRPPLTQNIFLATAISLGGFSVGLCLFIAADILADRSARRASAGRGARAGARSGPPDDDAAIVAL